MPVSLSVSTFVRVAIALTALTAIAARTALAAPVVACELHYGGEARTLRAAPTTTPYQVKPVAIGSYFLFRIVFETRPDAGIVLTTFADHEDGPVPIHVAHHPYPPPRGGRYGFTGEQFAYEPVRDGELRYWCRLETGSVAAR